MFLNKTEMEVNLADKKGRFIFDHDIPLSVAKEMIFQVMKHLMVIEDHLKSLEDQKKAAEVVAEEPKQEESEKIVEIDQSIKE